MAADRIHFDTNYLIGAALPGSAKESRLLEWLGNGCSLAVSAAVWAEFLCGPVSPADVVSAEELLGEPLPLGPEEATLAASCFNAAGRRRGTLVDCMIAATAITAGAALATANVDDFRRLVPLGLRLAT